MAKKMPRKHYLIERGLQLRFTRFVTLFVFISCVVTGLTIFYTTFMMLGERLADVYPQGRLVTIFKSVHVVLFIEVVIFLPIIFLFSILFSHRIAGPLPKIYATLREIGLGNFNIKLTLRKGDELKELADVINEMARNLRDKGQGS